MATNWDAIRKDWETSKITLADLAEKHGVKLGTLKSRKSREGWTRGKDATASKKVATKSKRMQPKNEPPEPVILNDELTDKQQLFCLHYIKCFNATKAYQKAYGCSYWTAATEGNRALKKPHIAAEIERLKAEQATALMLDARDVLQKYIDIAFADITDYVSFGSREVLLWTSDGQPVLDKNGKQVVGFDDYVTLNDSQGVDGTIVTEVKQGRDGVTVKLADKMKALDFLAKHLEMLNDTQKERLEAERTRTLIAKTQAEIDRMQDDGDEDDSPFEIIIKRKGES